jgi:hypothetical protein
MHSCTCDALLGTFHQRIAQLPGHRKGHKTPDSLHDAARGACGIFVPPYFDFWPTRASCNPQGG